MYFYTPLLKVLSVFMQKNKQNLDREKKQNIKKLVFALIAHFVCDPEYTFAF